MNIHFKKITYLAVFILLLKTLPSYAQPTVEWDKTYGGKGYETLEDAFKTQDEGFLLIGSSSSEKGNEVSEISRGNSDFWVVRIDSTGKKLWDKRMGGNEADICNGAVQNTQGYLLVGESRSPISGEKSQASKGWIDYWIVQIRPDGSVVWDKTYGGSEEDKAFSVVALPNEEGYIVAGHSISNAGGDKSEDSRGGYDIWVLRIDGNGNKVWDKTFGGNGYDDYPSGMIVTKDGNIAIACGTRSSQSGDKTGGFQGVKDYWILKISPDGNKIWDKSYGGDGDDSPRSLQELADESMIIVGNSASKVGPEKSAPHYGEADFWLLRVDKNGNKIWDKSFGGVNFDYGITIDQNKTGYFLVAGQSISYPSGSKEDSLKGLFDFWVLYLNEKGEKLWEKSLGGNYNDAAFKMVRFRDGAYLVCGLSNSGISGDKTDINRDPKKIGDIVIRDPNRPDPNDPSNRINPSDLSNDMWIVKINCITELNIQNDTLVCKLKPVTLDATIPNCRNCLYQWSTGETTATVTVNPKKTTKYIVTVTANNACVVTDNATIVIVPPPEKMAFTITQPRCTDWKDGVIALDSVIGGTPPFSLIFGNDTLINQIFKDKVKAGKYPIVLIDKNKCSIMDVVEVPNPSPFVIELPPNQDLQFGDSLRLFVKSNHKLDTFFWTDRTIKTLDSYVKPFDSQNYGLTAIDEFGCSKTAVTQITVRRDNLFFPPQAFSPNGDKVNDFYQLFGGKTVVSIDDMRIFDRWGTQVHEVKRIFPANEEAGWDGRIRGREALPGVYVFFATVTYIDGRKELIKGDFLLAR
jgi:gliding motility-associated-like protein